MRTVLGLGMALLAGTPALADASYLCRGEVRGPVSGMVITQVVDASGKGKDANLRWFAPHPAGKAYPTLMIDYKVPDIGKQTMGAVTQVTATMAVVMTAIPKAKTADLVLTFADGSSVRTPWQLYGVERGPEPPAGAPLHLEVSGSATMITGKPADAAQDAALIKGLGLGGNVRVWVQGDDGTVLADNTADLRPTPEQQVQLQDTLSQLRRDVIDPDLSCKPR